MELAASNSWMPIHLVIAVGILSVVGTLTLLPWAISQPRAASFARLGATAALVGGTALVLAFAALDGYAQNALAGIWRTSAGTDPEAIETIAITLALRAAAPRDHQPSSPRHRSRTGRMTAGVFNAFGGRSVL
jgi:hypothetical protein